MIDHGTGPRCLPHTQHSFTIYSIFFYMGSFIKYVAGSNFSADHILFAYFYYTHTVIFVIAGLKLLSFLIHTHHSFYCSHLVVLYLFRFTLTLKCMFVNIILSLKGKPSGYSDLRCLIYVLGESVKQVIILVYICRNRVTSNWKDTSIMYCWRETWRLA